MKGREMTQISGSRFLYSIKTLEYEFPLPVSTPTRYFYRDALFLFFSWQLTHEAMTYVLEMQLGPQASTKVIHLPIQQC